MDEAADQHAAGPRRPGIVRRALKLAARLFLGLLVCAGLYFGAAEIAMRVPVNADADPMAGTVPVYFVSNGPHIDIVLPMNRPEKRWGPWLAKAGFAKAGKRGWNYAIFGWGDRDFFTKVPSWSELRPGIALRGALWPTPTAMRVGIDGYEPESSDRVHLVRLSTDAYAELCVYVEASFSLDAAGLPQSLDVEIPNLAETTQFFHATGSYHMLHTCNSWTNGALKVAGQRAALWAPMSRGVQRQLPKNHGVPD